MAISKIITLNALCGLTFMLGACTQTASAPEPVVAQPAPRVFTRPDFKLPDGSGCMGAVNRYRAVMDNDIETGHTTKSVYDLITAEINKAAAMCSNGQNGAAHISATRSRFGYPAS